MQASPPRYAPPGDLDGERKLAVGARGDANGGSNRSAVWVLFFDGVTSCCADCHKSTGNGVCDIFDFICYQDAFVAGCP